MANIDDFIPKRKIPRKRQVGIWFTDDEYKSLQTMAGTYNTSCSRLAKAMIQAALAKATETTNA